MKTNGRFLYFVHNLWVGLWYILKYFTVTGPYNHALAGGYNHQLQSKTSMKIIDFTDFKIS